MIRKLIVISLIITMLVGCSNQVDQTINKKSVISECSFTGSNRIEYRASLFADEGSIYLSINNSSIMIDPTVSNLQQNLYTMEFRGSMIAVIQHLDTVKGPNIKVNFYKYDDKKIQLVFSTADITCEINDIEVENGKVVIGLPFGNSTATYMLTDNERELSQKIISELKENSINIDHEFLESIAQNISCSPINIKIADVDENGKEEVLLLTNIHTLGAKTPIRINTNAVFLFEILDQSIQFVRVVFDSNKKSDKEIFSYFPNELIIER